MDVDNVYLMVKHELLMDREKILLEGSWMLFGNGSMDFRLYISSLKGGEDLGLDLISRV